MRFARSTWLLGLALLCQALAILLVQCTNPASDSNRNQKITKVIDAVRTEFAPDKRTAYFSVALQEESGKPALIGATNIPEAAQALHAALQAEGLDIETAVEVLPEAQLNGNHYALVKLSVSNIRSEPKHSAELATQALMGTPLKVWGQQGDWYLIQTPDQYLGWVDAGGIQLMTEREWMLWRNASRYIFVKDKGFLMAGPQANGAFLSDLLYGNIMEVVGSPIGDYVRVKLPDGRIGFVEAGAVQLFDAWKGQKLDNVSRIIQTAFSYMGRPYLWGGTSGNGVDCSGFTKSVFFQNGLILPRDASQQVKAGTAVETDSTWQNLAPGDFLFFGKKATEEQAEKITHVAIYLGNGKIIHATGRVLVESLVPGDPDFTEERYQSFVCARRMVYYPFPSGVVPVRDVRMY